MLCHFARLSILFTYSCAALAASGSGGVRLDVPFVKQEKKACGAACIAMVMQYWLDRQVRSTNESIDVEEIQRALYSPGTRGVYASEMERYFREHGFRAFPFRGDWAELRQHLEKGRPLIVALRPSRLDSSLHYVVVAGMDWEQELVLLNDPAQRKLLKQDRAGFEKQWSATGKWTLLALPTPADGG
jgi:ABC-type bacteriocin/lantibiotic exporter with double-glycine peptidase domain